MYETILVPLDGSARAEQILPHVEETARRFSSGVVFLQIVASQNVSQIDVHEFTGQIKEADAYLSVKSNEFRRQGIDAKAIVRVGPVVATIIDVAAEEDADLIALASHGRSGLSRVFYGSTAAGVLQRVDRPLLLIRSQKYA
jgi:nucleotide-binding universal stress UspA family protein